MFGAKRTLATSAAGLTTEMECEARDDYLISLVTTLNNMHDVYNSGLHTVKS